MGQLSPATRDQIESDILAFFDRNPDEELSISDACVKFDYSLCVMSPILYQLELRGFLWSRRESVDKKVGSPRKFYMIRSWTTEIAK